MVPTGPKFAVDLLIRLSSWAPWIWSGSSLFGVVILLKMWSGVRKGRRKIAWQALTDEDGLLVTLVFFERLLMVSVLYLVLLAFVGLGSFVLRGNALVGLGTLIALLLIPPFVTWVAFRAVKIRVNA